jgi:hypothetical protein
MRKGILLRRPRRSAESAQGKIAAIRPAATQVWVLTLEPGCPPASMSSVHNAGQLPDSPVTEIGSVLRKCVLSKRGAAGIFRLSLNLEIPDM